MLDILVSPSIDPPNVKPLLSLPPKEIYEKSIKAIQEAELLSKPGALHAFERSLALRSASPRIEAFHSYYASKHQHDQDVPKDCESWVDWYGKRLCTPDEVYTELGHSCLGWTEIGGHRICAMDKLPQDENPHPST